MKTRLLIFLSFFIVTLTLTAQRDTVFVDINDSSKVFQDLPTGYSIIDTVERAANKGVLITGTNGMCSSSNCGWNGLVPNYPDSLQNKFVHWSFKNSSGTSTGVVRFRKDGVLLDSLLLTNNSVPVNHADTFPTGSFDTLQFQAVGNGPDTIEFRIGFFQVRTEIRVALTTDLAESASTKNELNLFPNPSRSFIQFDHFESVLYEPYQIVDIKGRVILSGTVQENRFDISKLNPGLYFFMLPEKQSVLKFQKL